MRPRRLSVTVLSLVSLLIAELVLLPLPAAFADPASASQPATVPIAPAFSEQSAGVAPVASTPPTTASDQVSADGGLAHSIKLSLPPGRNGAAPSLALSYSSSASQAPSAFGAGWSLPLSMVRRSLRHGTPRINKVGAPHYDDTEGANPSFERDGVELIQDPQSPPDDRGIVYRDRADRTFSKSLYHAGSESSWLVIGRDGTRRYYGSVPTDSSVPEAVLRDDLGVSAWALVRTVDPFGNVVDYEYVQGPARAALTDPQLVLLPAHIRYGANTATGASHFVDVAFTYQTFATPLLLDEARGHVYLDRILQQIDINALASSPPLVRTYTFTIQPSPSTSRYLLNQVQEVAPGLSAPPIVFHYTSNLVTQFTPDINLAWSIDPNVMRYFDEIGEQSAASIPWSKIAQGWPFDWVTHMTPTAQTLSPPGIPSAFSFQDLNGDGAADILYQPTFAAGFGVPQPWVSFQRTASGFQSFYSLYGKLDPLAMASGGSQYADVDGDGVVDRISFKPFGTIQSNHQNQQINPAYSALCAWWFDHAGGYTDPPPESVADQAIAAYLVQQALIGRGVSTGAISGALSQVVHAIQASGAANFHLLDIGGVPNVLSGCYHLGTPQNPIHTDSDYLPEFDPGEEGPWGTGVIGEVTIEHGRMLDPNAQRTVVFAPMNRYPNIAFPQFTVTGKLVDMDDPQVEAKGLTIDASVYEPLIDLDHDGTPEIVTIKSEQNGFSEYGEGVWRIRQLTPVHELDDKNTQTGFTGSLHSIFNALRSAEGFVDPTKTSCVSGLPPIRLDSVTVSQPAPLVTQKIATPPTVMARSMNASTAGMAVRLHAPTVVAAPPIVTKPVDPTLFAKLTTSTIEQDALDQLGQLGLPNDDVSAVGKGIDHMLEDNSPIESTIVDWFHNHSFEGQRLIRDADWITTLLDVNGDGLPDLVMAKGATCYDPDRKPPANSDHQPGFDVYLNRGDRFETSPAPGARFSGGPFDMVRNWSSKKDYVGTTDGDRFPFSALSFADVDGDGLTDAILIALVDGTGYGITSGWRMDGSACVAGPSLWDDPFDKTPVECVWHGTGMGWRPDAQMASKLPLDSDTFNATFAFNGKTFSDGVQIGDRIRWVDLDGDGMVDLMSARTFKANSIFGGSIDPHRVYRNRDVRPDLLRGIDNGLGGSTQITYQPRPSNLGAHERIPMVPWVVDTITVDPQADGSDPAVKEVSTFSYGSAKYDFANRELLGFGRVTEARKEVAPDGQSGGTLTIERDFYQDEDSSPATPNPYQGLLRTRITTAQSATVESQQTTSTYEVVPPPAGGTVYRVRATGTTSTTCDGATCLGGAGPRVTVVHTPSDFNAYDEPQTVTTTSTRAVGDGFDGAITQVEKRTYDDETGPWILGLVTSDQRSDGSGTLFSWEEFTYDTLNGVVDGKVKTHTTHRLGIPASCGDPTPALVETRAYTPDGLVSDVSDNNNTFARVGGQAPHQHIDYDAATHSLPAITTDYYTSNGAPASLTERRTYDYRFGTVASVTDANGNTTQSLRDALGRPSSEIDASGNVVSQTTYDLTARPTTRTTTQYPGNGQPPVTRVEYSDGEGRLRQRSLVTAQGSPAVVEEWRRYDSLGEVAEVALPFSSAQPSFVSATGFAPSRTNLRRDALGRLVRRELPDGRVTQTSYAVGHEQDIDARNTPRDQYTDALGRLIAIDEHDLSPRTEGSPTNLWTFLTRDVEGRVIQVVDPDGNIRRFTYDAQDRLATGEAPHAPSASGSVYTWCYDGKGQETESMTPEGRTVEERRDELGRVLSTTHQPAELYASDNVSFSYDSPNVKNGLGRLTAQQSALGRWSIAAYDDRGDVTDKSFQSTLGDSAAPWRDGTFTSHTDYDLIGRPIAVTLPFDPTQLAAKVTLGYNYDSRGLPHSLTVDGTPWVRIDSYSDSGRPIHERYASGLDDTRTYDPLTDRLISTTLARAGTAVQAYGFHYDADDNPDTVTRTFGAGSPLAGPTITKSYGYDTLNRLTSASYAGIGSGTQGWTYRYSPAGNITLKDELSYSYDGPDPQAVTARVASGGAVIEQYGYDQDGNLTSAAPGPDGLSWSYTWDGDGRLRAATSAAEPQSSATNSAGARVLSFAYSPSGERILKRQSCNGGGCASWSDLFIGPLELRGSEASDPSGVQGYYDVDLGDAHVQLALRRDADGRLGRDAQADRFYYKDYLGSTALVTGPDGTLTSATGAAGRLEYAPYGEPLVSESGTERVRERFNGKELDESGLAYYGARYASPALGRWISRDPLILSAPETVDDWQAANLYSFSDNNPAARVDPDGRFAGVVVELAVVTSRYWLPYAVQAAETTVSYWPEIVGAAATLTTAALVRLAGQDKPVSKKPVTNELREVGKIPELAPGSSGGGGKAPPRTPRGTDVSGGGSGGSEDGPRKGRGKNNLRPNSKADGAHSTFKTDADGHVTGYSEWEPNPQNPSGFDQVKRFDSTGRSHYNKATGQDVPTPHVSDPNVPGEVRPPRDDEVPK